MTLAEETKGPSWAKCSKCGGRVIVGKTRAWCMLCQFLATSTPKVSLREMVELGETVQEAIEG